MTISTDPEGDDADSRVKVGVLALFPSSSGGTESTMIVVNDGGTDSDAT